LVQPKPVAHRPISYPCCTKCNKPPTKPMYELHITLHKCAKAIEQWWNADEIPSLVVEDSNYIIPTLLKRNKVNHLVRDATDLSSWAMAAICSTRSWWVARSPSNASWRCFIACINIPSLSAAAAGNRGLGLRHSERVPNSRSCHSVRTTPIQSNPIYLKTSNTK